MWKTDIEKWQNISVQTAEFYVTLAEKRLDESVESSKSASDKSEKLLALNITLFTSILAYLTNTNFKITYFNLVLAFVIIFLSIQLFYLYKNNFIYKIGTKGEEPQHILKKEFIESYEDDEQYLNLALHICETYQEKINSNNIVNGKRAKNLIIAIYLFLGLPSSLLLALVQFLF